MENRPNSFIYVLAISYETWPQVSHRAQILKCKKR